jgi:shikimate kinase
MALSIFVIGPSGVGKTTLINAVDNRLEDMVVIDLDAEVKRRDPSFSTSDPHWARRYQDVSRKCIVERENSFAGRGTILLFDVGAGFLESPLAFDFLQERNTVLVWDTKENCLRKNVERPNSHWTGCTPEHFAAIELSPARHRIYESATVCVDVGSLTRDNAAARLIALVNQLKSDEGLKQ